MADWQRTLNLQPEWEQALAKEISVQALAKVVADRLAKLEPFGDEFIDTQRSNLVEEFTWLAEDPESEVEEFDELKSRLYDWADFPIDEAWPTKRVCWVKTVG